MLKACALGISLDDALKMTPWELSIVAKERAQILEGLHEGIISAAWLNAVLGRKKKIPPLTHFLRREQKRKENAREEFQKLKEELGG